MPILVICQTNHALDQFLRHLTPFSKEIVRLGGRSKDYSLNEYNLKEKRKDESYFIPEIAVFNENLNTLNKEIFSVFDPIFKEMVIQYFLTFFFEFINNNQKIHFLIFKNVLQRYGDEILSLWRDQDRKNKREVCQNVGSLINSVCKNQNVEIVFTFKPRPFDHVMKNDEFFNDYLGFSPASYHYKIAFPKLNKPPEQRPPEDPEGKINS